MLLRNTAAVGRLGESLAADYLRRKGYRILCRNYKTRVGELDLIAAKGRSLVFIEVKTRTADLHSKPFEAVDHKKQKKICRLVEGYLAYGGIRDMTAYFEDVRIDVISIVIANDGRLTDFEHIKDAFSVDR